MSRAKWKGLYIDTTIVSKLMERDKSKITTNKKEIKTQVRNSVIIPKFIGLTFFIYNGKSFSDIQITENMVGHKLGEFSPSRKNFIYKKKKKNK